MMMRSFVSGVLVGGLIVWQWRARIQDYLAERTRGIRLSAADRLQGVQDTAESVLDQARIQVVDTLRSGQDAIRPNPTPERRD